MHRVLESMHIRTMNVHVFGLTILSFNKHFRHLRIRLWKPLERYLYMVKKDCFMFGHFKETINHFKQNHLFRHTHDCAS